MDYTLPGFIPTGETPVAKPLEDSSQTKTLSLSIPQRIRSSIDQLATKAAFQDQFSQIHEQNHKITHLIQKLEGEIPELTASLTEKTAEINKLASQINANYQELAKHPANSDQYKKLKAECDRLEDMRENISSTTPIISKLKIAKENLATARDEKKTIDDKKALLNEAIQPLSSTKKIKLGASALASKTSLVATFLINKLIHPSTELFTHHALSKNKESLSKDQIIAKEAQDKVAAEINYREEADPEIRIAERLQIYTEDNIQLDGCIIYNNEKKNSDSPVMLMAQGNSMTYEMAYETAKNYSLKYGINVVLYNPRGVGHSLGTSHTTQDSVKDCKAAITYTLEKFCAGNPNKLTVYGHSLGGGVTAAALHELKKNKQLKEDVGLYINHHSFASLHDVVSAKVKAQIPSQLIKASIKKTAKFFLKALDLQTLNTKKIINNLPAKKIIVVSVEKDTILQEEGSLGFHIEKIKTLDSAKKINHVAMSKNVDHNEEDIYSSISPFLTNKNDLKELGGYQEALHSWVKENKAKS
jgi:alpha/beta superfamily hydrolase